MRENDVFVESGKQSWDTVGDGVQRQILGHDPQLMMVCVKFNKGSIGPVHRHRHRQVTFVGQGSFEVQIGSEKKTLKSGDCFFVPPEIDHGVVALEVGTMVDVFTPTREDFLARK
ncbi:MAG: cupin domain-containing protein [Ignavibacteriales bacterium]|nr:cupin domain-containing protein [Ignavibacteriales bacterium]